MDADIVAGAKSSSASRAEQFASVLVNDHAATAV
jgi:hypothetical protein